MKKCMRCNVIFHSEGRSRCLYCDSWLMSVGAEAGSFFDGQAYDVFHGVVDFLRAAGRGELDRKQYMVGSYFRTRTYLAMYTLCRNDFKRGQEYSRLMVRPIDLGIVLSLPWFIVNLIDSIAFRLRYIGYCEKCQCKYEPKPRIAGHDKDECEYNREYTSIVTSIMSGKIALNEDEYIKQANEKLAQGKRSAYQDLCSKKSGIWAFLDLMSIWLTVCLIIFGIVRLTLPPVLEFFKHADFSS